MAYSLLLAGIVIEAITLVVVVCRQGFRRFPIFTLYLAWGLLGDAGGYYLELHAVNQYAQIYPWELAIDSLFQFGVLFELSRSVFKPVRQFLPKWFPILLGLVILIVCAAIWPLARAAEVSDLTRNDRLLLHLQQSFSILRILFFLALAGFSQLLSLDWRDRELQIATGLGIYSMVSVAVSVLHARPALRPQYNLMNELAAASYACSLLYWIVSFIQQEAARREFTPQMQSFLLAVAGTARTARMDLSESTRLKKDRNTREPKD